MSELYRVREFAELTGVTVRTLHHYDRLALLRPRRTGAGYRLYGARELERLEQIVALKYLGIPLRQIQTLLDRDQRSLPDLLRAQRCALEEKRRQLEQAIQAIRDAERMLGAGRQSDAAMLRKIIEVIAMQEKAEFFKKYYSDEAWSKMTERREKWDPAQQEEATRAWRELFREIRRVLDENPAEDPAGEKAQALAARWMKLVEGFTGGDPQIVEGLRKVWADRENWPAAMKQDSAEFGDGRVWEFIVRARRAGR